MLVWYAAVAYYFLSFFCFYSLTAVCLLFEGEVSESLKMNLKLQPMYDTIQNN